MGSKFYIGTGVFLVLLNFLGPRGIIQWVLVEQEIGRLQQKKAQVDAEVLGLKAELQQFKHSRIARERSIREELGYLKPGELSLEFVTQDPTPAKVLK